MEKILALLSEIKGYFTSSSAKLDKITAAEEQVKALTSDLATARQTIATLSSELETTKTEASAKAAEIVTLQAAVDAEKQKTTAVLAAQALPLDQIPAASSSGGEPKGNAFQTYQALLAKDPQAAGAFYAANAEEISKSRTK